MKQVILLSVLLSVPVLAHQLPMSSGIEATSNHSINFAKGELMQNIPNIIRSIPGMEQIDVANVPQLNINGKSVSALSNETINAISSASINRFDYMQPSPDCPNGVLLIYVDGI